MKKIYITGVSGTGKTTIVEELNKRGIYSVDIDSVEGLCCWKNKETQKEVFFEYGMDRDWIDANGWYCDKEKLIKILDVPKDLIVVVGIAQNQNDYLDLFNRIILLQCKEETFLERLENRTNNDFGKHQLEKEYILDFYKNFEKVMLEHGAVPVNTDNLLNIVVDDIVSKI